MEDFNANLSLGVSSGREGLGLLSGNGGVPVDESSENSSEGLNTERQRGDVQEEDVLDLSSEDCSLDGSTNGDCLIRIDSLIGLLSEELLYLSLDSGHSSHTSDEEDLIELILGHVGILHAELKRLDCSLDELSSQRLELGSIDLQLEMLGSSGIGREIG